jgi:hypothetical protein
VSSLPALITVNPILKAGYPAISIRSVKGTTTVPGTQDKCGHLRPPAMILNHKMVVKKTEDKPLAKQIPH